MLKTPGDKEWREKSDAEKLRIIKEQLENSGDENAAENASGIVDKNLGFILLM